MDYVALRAELDDSGGHPITGPYSLDDATAVDELNAVNLTRTKSSVSGADAFQVTDSGEFDVLTDVARSEWLSLCAIDNVDPSNGTPAAATASRLFGGGSTTLANLIAFRTENISRAVELGFGVIVIGDVQNARAL